VQYEVHIARVMPAFVSLSAARARLLGEALIEEAADEMAVRLAEQ
jgi:hypothetical protein